MKVKVLDKTTYSTSAGKIHISRRKLKKLRPDLYGVIGLLCRLIEKKRYGRTQLRFLKEQMYFGDSNPAIVLSVEPLLIIAAYSSDLDCIIPITFTKEYVKNYNLKKGTRLLSVNTCERGELQKDIVLGKNNTGLWGGFSPIIAEFVSNNKQRIEEKKNEFSEELWERVYKLGVEYREKYPDSYRDGRPMFSGIVKYDISKLEYEHKNKKEEKTEVIYY